MKSLCCGDHAASSIAKNATGSDNFSPASQHKRMDSTIQEPLIDIQTDDETRVVLYTRMANFGDQVQ